MVKYRAVAVAVAVAVSGGGAVAVAVAGLTKRFFNHIQKDFLINVWGYGNTGIHAVVYRHVRTLTDVYGQCFRPFSIAQT